MVELSCGGSCMKCLLFIFNIVFFVSIALYNGWIAFGAGGGGFDINLYCFVSIFLQQTKSFNLNFK